MKVKILGSGGSKGIPQAGNFWGEANPSNNKNRRTRCSILVEINSKNFLIDTGLDFRNQMNLHNISKVDALLYTHGHSDHIDGISDVLEFGLDGGGEIKTYLTKETHGIITHRFSDLFDSIKNFRTYHFVNFNLIEGGKVDFSGKEVELLKVKHGNLNPLAFRCENFAYVPDFNEIPEETLKRLEGLDVLLINANEGFHKASPTTTHRDFYQIMELNECLKAKKVILNHLSNYVDHERDEAKLPEGFVLAYDGMEFEI
ncbi:MAG: MBL fold metallo-hydrolase [Alphaproteobacteria bacterium]|nr:MBL fold metallo-hydrolase [Alphaproteobacteria bacterium]